MARFSTQIGSTFAFNARAMCANIYIGGRSVFALQKKRIHHSLSGCGEKNTQAIL